MLHIQNWWNKADTNLTLQLIFYHEKWKNRLHTTTRPNNMNSTFWFPLLAVPWNFQKLSFPKLLEYSELVFANFTSEIVKWKESWERERERERKRKKYEVESNTSYLSDWCMVLQVKLSTYVREKRKESLSKQFLIVKYFKKFQ